MAEFLLSVLADQLAVRADQDSGVETLFAVRLQHAGDQVDLQFAGQRGQFLENGSGRIAYIVRDNMATRTKINTGARSLSSVEVLGGLQLGDKIIISSTEAFRGAQTVLLTQ